MNFSKIDLDNLVTKISLIDNPKNECGLTASFINGDNYEVDHRCQTVIDIQGLRKKKKKYFSKSNFIDLETIHDLLDKYGKIIIDVDFFVSGGHVFTLFKIAEDIFIIDSFINHYSVKLSLFDLEDFVDLINFIINKLIKNDKLHRVEVLTEWLKFWNINYSDEYLTYWDNKLKITYYY